MTNSCGKTTVNWLRLHPVGLISVTIPIFRTLSTQGQMFSWYQFDIPILMRTYLLFSIIQILNKRTSRVQKTDWDVSTTATDKFILLCPALLIIHHEYKGKDVLLGTLLKLKTPLYRPYSIFMQKEDRLGLNLAPNSLLIFLKYLVSNKRQSQNIDLTMKFKAGKKSSGGCC